MSRGKRVHEFDPATAIYTPSEKAAYGIAAIEEIRANRSTAMTIGMPEIRDYFAPLAAGQVAGVIAQTSNYKSGFLHFIEHVGALQLAATGRTDEAIIHVSVEEAVEEIAFLDFARESEEDAGKLARGDVQNWDQLLAASIKVAGVPIYSIGDSLARAEDFPLLTLSNIYRSIQHMVTDLGIKPAMIAVDYLQALPIDEENRAAVKGLDAQRRLQVRSDVYRLRQMAKFFHCPIWVGIQAKQDLAGKKDGSFLMPGVYDGEETASIAQRFDRLIGLWMPKMSYPIGQMITFGDLSFRVDENLIFLKVLKQRGGLPSGRMWRCRINFKKNLIAPEIVDGETSF